MSRIKCFIVDDEPVARKIIREYVADTDFLELTGEAESVEELRAYSGPAIQLLFLDVQMPGMNGIEYLRGNAAGIPAILTTAYPEYALQGYELDVLDYLVKPISCSRFLKAVTKARDFYALREKADAQEEMLFIKCNRKIERILIREIRYVEAMANYVIVHTAQRKYITYLSLGGMSEKLPSAGFVRIHKSFLIAIPAIISIVGNKALLGGTTLPISRYYRHSAIKQIKEFG